jgi:hypothetical protein
MAQTEDRGWSADDLAVLYQRFFAPLYDLAIRVTWSEPEAAEAVGRAFAQVHAELGRVDVEELRTRLFALLIAELPPERTAQTAAVHDFARLDADRLANPDALLDAVDVVFEVWATAAALPVRDYLLLDLQLRQGLRDRDLARALATDAKTVELGSQRIRARFENVQSPVAPVALFAALAPVPAPPGLAERVWSQVVAGPRRPPQKKRAVALPGKPIVGAAAIVLLAAAAVAGAFFAVRGGDPGPKIAFRSASHRTDRGSENPDVEVAWTPRSDVDGYSVSWSAEPATPDTAVDLPGAAVQTTGHLKPGTSWFNLRALGNDGKWSRPLHFGPFLILPDTVAPQTAISDWPGRFGTATAVFAFASNEHYAALECSLDGQTFARCTSPKTYENLSPGEHRFRVRAVDEGGNTDPTPATRRWSVDNRPPQTELTRSPAAYSQDVARFEFGSSEKHSTFACKLDGGKFVVCSSPKTYRSLGDGPHRFRVRAVDRAGNPDPSAATRKWTVDTEPPETTIDSGPPAVSHKPTATFTLSSEAGASFECRLDGHAWGGCGEIAGLDDGRHVLRARARDRAQNVDPTPARYSWRVDLPPQTSLTSGPSGPTSSTSATFRFSSDDTAATFQCKLDDRSWSSCTSGKTFTGLPQGSHTFEVRARDSAGTNDRSPAARTWKVDTVAPDTTITSVSVRGKAATLSFSSSEQGSTFECQLDQGAWQACSSPKTYRALGHGPHRLRVRATDAAGNRDQTPAMRSFST